MRMPNKLFFIILSLAATSAKAEDLALYCNIMDDSDLASECRALLNGPHPATFSPTAFKACTRLSSESDRIECLQEIRGATFIKSDVKICDAHSSTGDTIDCLKTAKAILDDVNFFGDNESPEPLRRPDFCDLLDTPLNLSTSAHCREVLHERNQIDRQAFHACSRIRNTFDRLRCVESIANYTFNPVALSLCNAIKAGYDWTNNCILAIRGQSYSYQSLFAIASHGPGPGDLIDWLRKESVVETQSKDPHCIYAENDQRCVIHELVACKKVPGPGNWCEGDSHNMKPRKN